MPKRFEEQCKICRLYTEDRLLIEDKLRQGQSLNQVLKFIREELGYTYISSQAYTATNCI